MTVPARAAVGVVGLNGAGKSTLIKLVCRFYEVDSGAIYWDGVELRELDPLSLRQRTTAAFQDFMAYDFCARENVGVGDIRQIDDISAIARAANLAGIGWRLAAMADGWETMLSRSHALDGNLAAGVSLSGGEWQRVALARSLMRTSADLVILDEPSSNLDAEAEYLIHSRLRDWTKGRTSISISHRLNTIRYCDVIYVLKNGVIAEFGDHQKLMQAHGEYARLFGLQSRGYHANEDSKD